MIKTVEIQEFDKDVLKEDSFISFCYTKKEATDVGIVITNGFVYNGMIKHVDSKNITITLPDGEIKRIFIEEILKEEKRILGILSNAIAPIEPEPDVAEIDKAVEDVVEKEEEEEKEV